MGWGESPEIFLLWVGKFVIGKGSFMKGNARLEESLGNFSEHRTRSVLREGGRGEEIGKGR